MRRSVTLASLWVAGAILFFAAGSAQGADLKKTSCVTCHTNKDMASEESIALVGHYGNDVHATKGLSCHDCHGGNPDPAVAEDMGTAMDPTFAANPYRGAPARKEIPDFCGRCHSSLQFMRRFNPAARVDQVDEYWTSQHGQKLKTGDEAVATCLDCHGGHGMRGVGDPESKVYPTKVADTCAGCHANAQKMAGRHDGRGRAFSIDQQARWRQSVHAIALMDKGDLSAPTCNDCHGNHGAAPPGVASVANVCGRCHGREAELFQKSAKAAGFVEHNEYLSTAEGGCASCHEGIPAAAQVVNHFSECVSCHENHGVIRPTVALLGFLPDVPCAFCHEGEGEAAKQLPETEKRRKHYQEVRDGLLKAAAAQQLSGDERFDWLVDQALALSFHNVTGSSETQLRPEFDRLFEKFRIGKTHYVYKDPVTGSDRRAALRRCTDCHIAEDSAGRATAAAMVKSMREVTSLTASAERTLLAAKRGGVEVRSVHSELDAAVDNQIELEVLVHSFSSEGAFKEKHAEAVAHALAASKAGEKSMGELASRRRGLGAALGVIALVLLGLGLKIRELSRRPQ